MRCLCVPQACLLLTFFAALIPPVAAAESPGPGSLSLNGPWEFSIHGRGRKIVQVSSTYYPVGGATLERTFAAPPRRPGQRTLLRFAGVAMTAEILLNEFSLGSFGPYTPFVIDVSDQLREGENRLRVEVSDLDGIEPWGRRWVTAFPRFGGIIRDVTLEVRPETYYEDGERGPIRLENGVHFADYRLFFGLSRIDAVAVDTERALSYRGDHGTKSYQMRLFTHRPRHSGKKIAAIEFNLHNFDYVPLLAAITVRTRPFE